MPDPTWEGISATQHAALNHVGATGVLVGGQDAVANLVGGDLPATGSIALLTDVAGVITALRNATDARLDLIETKVNEILAALRASTLISS